jgi:hypothetical protein
MTLATILLAAGLIVAGIWPSLAVSVESHDGAAAPEIMGSR